MNPVNESSNQMQTWKEIILCYNITFTQPEFVLFIRNYAGRWAKREGILGGALVKWARHRVLGFPKTESWPPSCRLWIRNRLPGEEHQKIHVLYLAFIFTHRQGSGFGTLTLFWFYQYRSITANTLRSPELTEEYFHYSISAQTKQSATLLKSPAIPNSNYRDLCSIGISRGCRNWPDLPLRIRLFFPP